MAAAGMIETLTLPPHLEAAEPPEARGLARDEVRLLVASRASGRRATWLRPSARPADRVRRWV